MVLIMIGIIIELNIRKGSDENNRSNSSDNVEFLVYSKYPFTKRYVVHFVKS